MTRIGLIADRSTAACFKLGGLEDVFSVESVAEAEKCLRTLLEKEGFAVILISERIVSSIMNVVKEVAERKYPIVIPIPDTKGKAKMKTDLIVELIRSKTGIEVKL